MAGSAPRLRRGDARYGSVGGFPGLTNDLIGRADAVGDLLDRSVGVHREDEVAVGEGLPHPGKAGADALLLGDGLVDLQLVGRASGGDAGHAGLGLHVEQDAPVGAADAGAAEVHVGHPVVGAVHPLVGHGGVVVAVGDDGLALCEPAGDLLVVPDAVKEKERGKAAVARGLLPREGATERLAVLGGRGLGGEHHGAPDGLQRGGQGAHLGGLSGAVHAVKDNEQGGFGGDIGNRHGVCLR